MGLYSADILKQVREALDPIAVLKLIGYRTDTIQQSGDVIRCFCPIHKEAVFRTLTIDAKTRQYKCSYTMCDGARGGDLIDLVAKCAGADPDETVQALVEKLKIPVTLPPTAATIERVLELAGRSLEQGQFAEAVRRYEEALAVQPERVAALQGLMQACEGGRDEEGFLKAARKLAAIFVRDSRPQDAAALCQRILESRPDDEEVLALCAQSHAACNERTRALEIYMRLADVLENKGQFDRAIEVYRAVEKMDLDIVDVFPHLIDAMVASDRTAEALNETEEKLARYTQAGEWDRALECMKAIFHLDEQRDDMRRRYIETCLEAGPNDARLEGALDALEELVERHALLDAAAMRDALLKAWPRHPRLMKLAALIHEASGEADAAAQSRIALADHLGAAGAEVQARSILEELRRRHPDSIPVLSRLARMYRNSGETANALDAFKQIVAQLERASASGGGNGHGEEVLPTLQTICDMAPENLEAQYQFIRVALASGQAPRAVGHIQRLLRRFEDARHFAPALDLIERHGQLVPDQGGVLSLKARCLDALERPDDARAALAEACQAYARANDAPAALDALQRFVQRHPDDTIALDMLMDCRRRMRQAPPGAGPLRDALLKSLERSDATGVKRILPKFIDAAPRDAETLESVLPQLLDKGMRPAAVTVCDRLIETFTERGATRKALEYAAMRLSLAADQPDSIQRALGIARAARRFGPVAAALLEWARVQEDLNNTRAAIDLFETQLRDFPEDNDLRGQFLVFLAEGELRPDIERRALQIATEWARSRHAAEAERFVRERIAGDPDNLLWGEILLTLLRESGQKEAWRDHCLAFAQRLAAQHQYGRIIDILGQLLESDPLNVAARQQIIAALRALRRIPEAGAHALRLARQLIDAGQTTQAEAILRRAAELAPEDAPLRAALAACYQTLGDADSERRERWRLADLHEKSGAIDLAIAEIQRILERDPANTDARRRFETLRTRNTSIDQAVEQHSAQAASHHESGNVESEIAAYQAAVKLKPADTGLRRRLAQAYFDSGAASQGIEQLEEVARRYFSAASYDTALAHADEILAIDPARLSARRLRAECLARLGDDRRALEEFLKISENLSAAPAPAAEPEDDPLEGALDLVEEYSFDHFVVGSPNNFAYATCMAVARAPAQQYNPLFLYSDVGLGKTHLLNAIANHLARAFPDMKIVYVSADDFASRLVEAISNNRIRAFRNRFKNAGALMIDDIQFLAGKERAQEEFFNIFNTLFQARKQIVITSDRPPKDLAPLEKRLRSRFGAGVVVDIQRPDQETREAILRRDRAALGQDAAFPDEVIQEVARAIDTNVRELKAAFRQILANAEVSGRRVTVEDARQVLERLRGN